MTFCAFKQCIYSLSKFNEDSTRWHPKVINPVFMPLLVTGFLTHLNFNLVGLVCRCGQVCVCTLIYRSISMQAKSDLHVKEKLQPYSMFFM